MPGSGLAADGDTTGAVSGEPTAVADPGTDRQSAPDIASPDSTSPGPRTTTSAARVDWTNALIAFDAEGIKITRPRFVLEMPEVKQTTDTETTPQSVIHILLKPLLERLALMSVTQFRIEDGTVIVRSGDSILHEITKLETQFGFDARAQQASGSGKFTLRGEAITFDLNIRRSRRTPAAAVASSGEAASAQDGNQDELADGSTGQTEVAGSNTPAANATADAFDVDLNLRGASAESRFTGAIRYGKNPDLRGAWSLNVAEPQRVLALAGFKATTPKRGSKEPGPTGIRLSGEASWVHGRMTIADGTFRFGDNAAQGVLAIDLTKPRLALDGTLAAGTLYLDPFFPKAAVKADATSLFSSARGVDLNSQISLPLLQDFDADIRLSVNSIRLRGFRADKGALTLVLRSGILIADIAELHVFDGMALGQLELDGSKDDLTLSARVSLKDVLVEDGLGWLTAGKPLSGRSQVNLNVQTAGNTLGELIAKLSGDAKVRMVDGGQLRLNLDPLFANESTREMQGWGEITKGEMGFDTLQADLELRDGKVLSRTIKANSGKWRTFAYGALDLRAQKMSVRVSRSRIDPDSQSRAPRLEFNGPWDEPVIRVLADTRVEKRAGFVPTALRATE